MIEERTLLAMVSDVALLEEVESRRLLSRAFRDASASGRADQWRVGGGVSLTGRESDVLTALAAAFRRDRDEFVSVDELAQRVFGEVTTSTLSSVRVYVGAVRKKLPGSIQTAVGRGYRLVAQEEAA